MLIEDPNDQGFWAVTRHADLVECTVRHEDFVSGEGDRAHLAHESQYAGGWNDPELMGDDDPLTRMGEATINLAVLAQKNLQDRRRHPGTDLMSSLAVAEVDGERLTDAEILSFDNLLTVAGNDTTRQSLSHGVRALTDFPGQKAWLAADLDARMPSAIEALVRWATPIMTFRRTAARDCELGGGGIHHCLGNRLARRQIGATWRQLLTRLPDLQAVGPPDLAVSTFFHGINHQQVRFTPER